MVAFINTKLLYTLARYQGTARLMSNTFSSPIWMLPFSKHCKTNNMYWRHLAGKRRKDNEVYNCDEDEYKSEYSGWPTNAVNIEIPSAQGIVLVQQHTFNAFTALDRLGRKSCLSVFFLVQRNTICPAWNADSHPFYPSLLVKCRMGHFSKQ